MHRYLLHTHSSVPQLQFMVSRPFLRNVSNPRFESMRQRLSWLMLQTEFSHSFTVMDVLRHGLKVRFISALYRCQMDSSPAVVKKNNSPVAHWQPTLCVCVTEHGHTLRRSGAERREEKRRGGQRRRDRESE